MKRSQNDLIEQEMVGDGHSIMIGKNTLSSVSTGSSENVDPVFKKMKMTPEQIDSFSNLSIQLIQYILEFNYYYSEHSMIMREINRSSVMDLFGIKKMGSERVIFLVYPSIELDIYDNDMTYHYYFPISSVRHLSIVDKRSHRLLETSQSKLFPFSRMKSLESLEVFSTLLLDNGFDGVSSSLTYIHVKGGANITFSGIKTLVDKCHQLKILRLGNKGIQLVDDSMVEYISKHASSLKELSIPFHAVTRIGLTEVFKTSKIASLNLSENKLFENPSFELLSQNNTLTNLNLSYNKICDADVEQLVEHGKNLKHLHLCSLRFPISSRCISMILYQNSYEKVTIRHLKPPILDAAVFNLPCNISKLDISLTCGNETTNGNQIAEAISKNFSKLEFLSMRRCYLEDEGCIHLFNIPTLKHLNISYNNISDKALRHFSKFNTSIDTLHLNSNKNITNYGYRLLAYHPRLSSIKVSGKVGNDAICHILSNLKTCKYLIVEAFTKLTDTAFSYINDATSLEQLSVIGSEITMRSAQKIVTSPSLVEISIDTKLSNAVLKEFANSNIRVIHLPQDNFEAVTEGLKALKLAGKRVCLE